MLYIVRHGQNIDNLNSVLNDYNNDTPLTELGFSQAKDLGERLKNFALKIDKIFASPFLRTKQTAETIAKVIGYDINNIIYNDLLKERDFKQYAGKPVLDIANLAKEFNDDIILSENVTYFLGKNGLAETFEEVRDRARRFMEFYSQKDYGNTLIVAHGDLGKMLYSFYYNLPIEDVLTKFYFKNCDIIQLFDDRKEPANPYLEI